MSKFIGSLALALCLICGSATAWAKASPTASLRVLLEDHDHAGEEHEGHVEPAANEGEDGIEEGHGEGAETGEGMDGVFEGGDEGATNTTGTPDADEGADGEMEGAGEGVAEEASAAWAVSAPVALASAVAAVMVGM